MVPLKRDGQTEERKDGQKDGQPGNIMSRRSNRAGHKNTLGGIYAYIKFEKTDGMFFKLASLFTSAGSMGGCGHGHANIIISQNTSFGDINIYNINTKPACFRAFLILSKI